MQSGDSVGSIHPIAMRQFIRDFFHFERAEGFERTSPPHLYVED